jgi:hypothetical protein
VGQHFLNLRRVYIETSAINQAVSNGISGNNLLTRLKRLRLAPVIGTHVIYELARTFFNPQYLKRARALFAVLRDLEPSFVPQVRWLLIQEVDKLRHGTVVLPFLDYFNYVSTKYTIMQLAAGYFDKQAKTFIEGREREIRTCLPPVSQEYLSSIKAMKIKDPGLRRMHTFTQLYTNMKYKIPHIIGQILAGQGVDAIPVTISECIKLAHNLNSFPALCSTVRANLYWNSIHIIHDEKPALDKTSDYRHVINASYSDVFLTADVQLANTIPCISPSLEVMPWEALTS